MSKLLTKDSFDNFIKEGHVLIDFFAEWCGPCKMLGPIMDQLSSEITNVKIAKVNVDQESELSQKFSVTSIPTVVLFKDGKQIDTFNGFKPKQQIIDFINKNKK